MMLRGFRSYKEFLDSYEGIATNILADRLHHRRTRPLGRPKTYLHAYC
jgi:hypothetical protein